MYKIITSNKKLIHDNMYKTGNNKKNWELNIKGNLG